MDNIERIGAVLASLRQDCPGFRSAVLATEDGLVLACSNPVNEEMQAATATYITQVVEQHLGLLNGGDCAELAIRTTVATWHIARLKNGRVLMVSADPGCLPGMLRLLARRSVADLDLLPQDGMDEALARLA